MPVNFDFKKVLVVQKKLTVNGQHYDSLDEIPAEHRAAVQEALESGMATTTFSINGKTVSSIEELPAPLRAIVRGLMSIAMKSGDEASRRPDGATSSQPVALRPEPLLGMKTIIVLIGLAALLFWFLRSML